MNELLNLAHLFSDEKILAEQAIPGEKYSLENILKFIEIRDSFHPVFFILNTISAKTRDSHHTTNPGVPAL